MEANNLVGAVFNKDRTHRLQLWRRWNSNKPMVLFIMLNPSTGDEKENDPTIKRLISFAQNFNYGGFYIGNMFSYITPNSIDLCLIEKDQMNFDENNIHLKEMASKCKDVVFGRGNSGQINFDRQREIVEMFPEALCFKLTSMGFPNHPLYLPDSSTLDKYQELMFYYKPKVNVKK